MAPPGSRPAQADVSDLVLVPVHGSGGQLPMVMLKDDHHDDCELCAGAGFPTSDSARWPEPWRGEAL